MSAAENGLIMAGDIVAITGDKGFYYALLDALGSKAAGFINADLDTRADVYVGGDEAGGLQITYPKVPAVPPVRVAEDPRADDRVILIYCGDTARQREHLCGLVPVWLDATSPTFAEVRKAGGEAVSDLGLHVIDGEAFPTRPV